MKFYKIIFMPAFVLIPLLSRAQGDTIQYQYCEIAGREPLFGNKITVEVDLGQEKGFGLDNRMKDEQTGKTKIFNSMVEALNYMGRGGWEFVQAYVMVNSGTSVCHWLLRRKWKSVKTGSRTSYKELSLMQKS